MLFLRPWLEICELIDLEVCRRGMNLQWGCKGMLYRRVSAHRCSPKMLEEAMSLSSLFGPSKNATGFGSNGWPDKPRKQGLSLLESYLENTFRHMPIVTCYNENKTFPCPSFTLDHSKFEALSR